MLLPSVFDNFTLIFIELAVGLLICVVLAHLTRLLKQPLILAYIFTGVLISLLGVIRLGAKETLPLFASLGVSFLLFLVGIELRISDLKRVGKSALYTGIGQLLFTSIFGFILLKLLGFGTLASIYVAVALTFSSTIIVVKLLTEKKDLNSLYGKITIGFLLVQDFAAILALIFLTGFQPGSETLPPLLLLVFILLKAILLFGIAYLLSRFVLPTLFSWSATSPELLVITAISWCFIFTAFAKVIGFSFEIGAFLAGLSLASSPFHFQILSRVRPLRDFFVVIFFIVLGTGISINNLLEVLLPVVILSIFILIGNPLIVLVIMGFLGHRKRTSFLSSVTVAQISEFSLILVAAGERLGHLSSEMVSMVALIGIITISLSSYMIIYSDVIYRKLSKFLNLFEKKHLRESKIPVQQIENHIVLLGCEQVGRDLLTFFSKKGLSKDELLIVDFNPQIVDNLIADGYNIVYGDIADNEVLEELQLDKARLIISTIPDLKDNLNVIRFCRNMDCKGILVMTAYWARDAIKLYEAGADYVIVPEIIGGDYLAKILAEHWHNLLDIRSHRESYLERLIEFNQSLFRTV